MSHRPLSLEVFPVNGTLRPGGDTVEHLLLRVRAGAAAPQNRPRLTAVLVLDTSGSMGGEPIEQVVQSTQRLVDILGDEDSLGLVAFADGARTVAPLRRLDAEGRRDLRRAVGELRAGGQTNMSGGLAHAALLFPRRANGERHLALVLSDGNPNVGPSSAVELAEQAKLLKARDIAVSVLGYGAAHNEEVLIAIADAGGGRYAFVDDPQLAGASFARALGAQRDVVAEQVRLLLTPADGVEIKRILGNPPQSFGADGLRVTLEDSIGGDELNIVVELRVRAPRETGPWRPLKLALQGRVAGTADTFAVRGEAAVTLSHAGPYQQDPTALAAVAIGFADDLRKEARALADRGNFAGAAAVLRKAQAMIEGTPGYVENGSGPLNDARETLVDEVAAMERAPDVEKYQAFKRATRDYADFAQGGTKTRAGQVASPSVVQLLSQMAQGLPRAHLVVVEGPAPGTQYRLGPEMDIGRSPMNQVCVGDAMVTRRHARVVWNEGRFWVVDLGSSNGTAVNGKRVSRAALADGDVIEVGSAKLRFVVEPGAK